MLSALGAGGGALLRRGAGAVFAYATTALSTIAAIALLGRHLSPPELQAFLVYLLVAATSAGIEPGTAKGFLLRRPEWTGADAGAIAGASALKAVAVSPVFALLWVTPADAPPLDWRLALLTPVVVALSFVVTDLRVLLDARGRHAAAIWLKQGSLATAIVAGAASLLAGASLALAVALGCAARALVTLALLRGAEMARPASHAVRAMLRSVDWRWMLAASVLGAVAATIDRVVAFRLLPAATANAYVLLYEILSKFWLLPYLLGPILFVRVSRNDGDARFLRMSLVLTIGAAAPFLAIATLLPLAPVNVLRLGAFGPSETLVFAVAIVVSAVNQLLVTRLQARSGTRAATAVVALGLATSVVCFPLFTWLHPAAGLFWAWLAKSCAELAALWLVRDRRAER